jgi:hypothetical protein
MATINYAAREISVKIVYYGPGLSGKTTNLQIIHRKIPQNTKSDMVSLATETDRTLFFDFLPLDLGKIRGFTTKFQLYTVPGQVYYNATRKLVLRGVDGIVFIADSAADKIDENLESFQNMEENLSEYGYKRESIPIIIQYNKRDLPNALTVQDLDARINKYNLPWSEAVANKGKGVFESLKLIGKLVIDQLNQKYASAATKKRPAPATSGVQPQQPMQQRPGPVPPQQFQVSPLAPLQQPKPQPRAPQAQPSYGSINLEPMVPRPQPVQQAPKPAVPQRAGSELDLEMERYYEQVSRPQPQQFPSFPQNKPYPQEHLALHSDEPIFDPAHRPQGPSFQQPHPGYGAPQPMPQQFGYAQPSPFGYSGNPQSPQPEFQQPRPQFQGQEPGGMNDNEPMYFTSVNTDKYKRKSKKPVNPKLRQKTSIFKKLFNRE